MTNIYLRYPVDNVDVLSVGLAGFRKLDLYKDENMEFISKVADINKLDRVFSDFSNSFSVPATPNNNEIFRYYFDIDVSVEYAYNSNIKVDCYIEIDTTPYRFAALQLESVKTKEGKFDSYSIGIFSSITQLTDLFGEDKLSDLGKTKEGVIISGGMTRYDYNNTGSNYNKSIIDQDFNGNAALEPGDYGGAIMTPMINMSDKHWQLYGTTTVDSDGNVTTPFINITDPLYPFDFTSTRPAFRLIRFIEEIERKYQIKFSRDFFGRAEFMNLFMWLNKAEEFPYSGFVRMLLNQSLFLTEGVNNIPDYPSDIPFPYISQDNTTGGISITFDNNIKTNSRGFAACGFRVTSSNTNVIFSARIVDEQGTVLQEKTSKKGIAFIDVSANVYASVLSNTVKYITKTFFVEIQTPVPIPYTIRVQARSGHVTDGVHINYSKKESSPNNVLTPLAKISIADNTPDMKVSEFMQNIMKMFKLIIRPIAIDPFNPTIANGEFLVTTLNSYYLKGDTIDITQNIDFNNITIKKPEIYKEITFKYTKTDNFLAENFNKMVPTLARGYSYGDLRVLFTDKQISTKNKLEISIDWENMLYERMLNTDGEQTELIIGEAITSDDEGKTFTKNAAKTFLFYNNGIVSIDNAVPKTHYEGVTPDIALYYTNRTGNTNDYYQKQITQSINFGEENDPGHTDPVTQSLYFTKWRNWIQEIYDFRQRKFNFKAINLEPKTLTRLDLADTLIIKDNLYKIDDMKINLNTGDADLNLFRTFRPTEIPIFFKEFSFGTGTVTRSSDPLEFRDYLDGGDGTTTLLGNFTEIGGVPKNYIARVDVSGNLVDGFDVGSSIGDYPIRAGVFMRKGDDLYIGGGFFAFNGYSAFNIIKVNYLTGEVDPVFAENSEFLSLNDDVLAITDVGDGILVGGKFSSATGITPCTYLIKLNYDGSIWHHPITGDPFTPLLDGIVTGIINVPSILVPGEFRQVIVGSFTTYYGNIVNRIVSTNSSAVQPDYGTFGGLTATSDNVQIERVSNDPEESRFWLFGTITQINITPVNNIALYNSSTGQVISPIISLGGPDGPIIFGKRVLGDNLLIQGETTGFTKYGGIDTKALIINTNGVIVKTFPGENIFVYNTGETFYTVDLDTNTVSSSENNNVAIRVLNRTDIFATAGQVYYGIVIQKKIGWTVEKVNTGDGIDWITFNNDKTSGEGLDECTILIHSKMHILTEPQIFQDRDMVLKFTFADGSISTVNVIQKGRGDVIP